MNAEIQNIRIVSRHMPLTDAIKAYLEKKLQSLAWEFPKVIRAQAVLDVQRHRQCCGVLLLCNYHIRFQAREETDDMYASIGLCMSKLARQIRKFRTRIQRQRTKPSIF